MYLFIVRNRGPVASVAFCSVLNRTLNLPDCPKVDSIIPTSPTYRQHKYARNSIPFSFVTFMFTNRFMSVSFLNRFFPISV